MEASNVRKRLPVTIAYSFANLSFDIKLKVAWPIRFSFAPHTYSFNCKVEYWFCQRVKRVNFWVLHIGLMDSKIEKVCTVLFRQKIVMEDYHISYTIARLFGEVDSRSTFKQIYIRAIVSHPLVSLIMTHASFFICWVFICAEFHF